jgi:hypothetical protein
MFAKLTRLNQQSLNEKVEEPSPLTYPNLDEPNHDE